MNFRSVKTLGEDVWKLSPYCDVLSFAFHIANLYLLEIAMHEHQVSLAIINAEVNTVTIRYAHYLKGI